MPQVCTHSSPVLKVGHLHDWIDNCLCTNHVVPQRLCPLSCHPILILVTLSPLHLALETKLSPSQLLSQFPSFN